MTTTTTLTNNKCPNCGRTLYYYNDKSDALFDEMSPTITKIVCPFCMSGWNVNSVTRHISYQVAATPMVQRGEKVNRTLDTFVDTNAKIAHYNAREILRAYSGYIDKYIDFSYLPKKIIEAKHLCTGYCAQARKHPHDKYDETIGKAVALLRLLKWPNDEITKAIFG